MSNNGTADWRTDTGPIIGLESAPSEVRSLFGLPPSGNRPDEQVTAISPEERKPLPPRSESAQDEPDVTASSSPASTPPLPTYGNFPVGEQVEDAEEVAEASEFIAEDHEPSTDLLDTTELPPVADEPSAQDDAAETSDVSAASSPSWKERLANTSERLRERLPSKRLKSDDDEYESLDSSFDEGHWDDEDEDEESSDSNPKSVALLLASALALAVLLFVSVVLVDRTSFSWQVDLVLAVLLVLAAIYTIFRIYESHKGTTKVLDAQAKIVSVMLQYRWPTIVLISIAFAAVTGLWYSSEMDSHDAVKPTVFGLIMGLGIGVLVKIWFRQERNRIVSQRQRDVDSSNVYKKNSQRDYWVLTDDEDKVEYWSRPPWIEGFILCGNGVMLAVAAFWMALRFPGFVALMDLLEQVSNPAKAVILSPLALCVVWSYYSFKEKPLRNQKADATKPYEFKFFGQEVSVHRLVIGALGLVPFAAGWWWLDWPVIGWAFRRFHEDPYRLAWLVFTPAAIWALARLSYYLGSFRGVTDGNFWIGSTGYFLGRNVSASMDRADLTGTSSDQPWAGRLLGYSRMQRESAGQLDAQFQDLRIPHEAVFRQFLGKSRQS